MKNAERVALLIEAKKLSTRKLEASIGVANGVLSRAIKNKTDVLSETLSKIIEAYPEVNGDWLLTGRGVMYTMEAPVTLREEDLMRTIKTQEKLISSQERIIENQRSEINALHDEVKTLKQ